MGFLSQNFTDVLVVLGDFLGNLPLSAPVDYMHQVLIGVLKYLLSFLCKVLNRSAVNAAAVSDEVAAIKRPKEIRREVRGLDQLVHFKASERKSWLLYIGPVVFKNRLPDEIFDIFLLLSFSIRMLLESDSEENVVNAEQLLDEFGRRYKSIWNEKDSKTADKYCVHSLRHLAWQVRHYGPLGNTSSVSFESANHLLTNGFKGTVAHCSYTVKTYLRQREVFTNRIYRDNIEELTRKWSGLAIRDNELDYSKFVTATEHVVRIRTDLPDSIVYGRTKINHRFYDSVCYSRADAPDSYLSYHLGDGKIGYGQIELFYRESPGNQLLALIRDLLVVDWIRCPGMGKATPKVFLRVCETGATTTVAVSTFSGKYAKVISSGKIYFVELCEHFEHD